MRYLGGLRGDAVLTCGEAEVGHASYEFDGFVSKGGHLSGSGEIRVDPETLERVFAYSDLRLQTDDGQSLSFRFSEKELQPPGDAAHVVLIGTLPPISKWRH
jgi:hypothetical protein